MKIGYARVSTLDQNLDLQIDALKAYGCEKIYQEKVSSGKVRKELEDAFNDLRKDDIFVVWKMDRLGRSTKHLIEIALDLQKRGIQLVFLSEGYDTTTPHGKLVFHIMAALAECERDRIRERTNAGLAAARARGRVGGRPKTLTPEKLRNIKLLSQNHELSIKEICTMLDISKGSYYNGLKTN